MLLQNEETLHPAQLPCQGDNEGRLGNSLPQLPELDSLDADQACRLPNERNISCGIEPKKK
jgi:hypothetical protein